MAVWRAVEAEVTGSQARLDALAAMTAAYHLHRSEHRADAHRQRLVRVRAVKFRKMLVASDALPMPVKLRAAAALSQHHPSVTVSALADAIGWAGKMALARIRVAPDYDLPPGRFELGLPKMSETETPAGRPAIIVAPGYPNPVDLIAITLRDGKAYRLCLDGEMIPHGRSSLSRRVEESWTVHVHPAAWASARAAAVLAGVSPDAAPALIADPGAMDWTRKGDLGVIKTLNVVDARGDDPADPVHAIWRAIPAATRKTVALNIPKSCSNSDACGRDSTQKSGVAA
ncbi:MAG: hypothetical protein COB49_01850 [Alphaproteobacteria bacterium]|nr:MAG: hypothetical protein COB49_01850 [Alphaproteobacteria bacterium]